MRNPFEVIVSAKRIRRRALNLMPPRQEDRDYLPLRVTANVEKSAKVRAYRMYNESRKARGRTLPAWLAEYNKAEIIRRPVPLAPQIPAERLRR